jgi:hypothetical protein
VHRGPGIATKISLRRCSSNHRHSPEEEPTSYHGHEDITTPLFVKPLPWPRRRNIAMMIQSSSSHRHDPEEEPTFQHRHEDITTPLFVKPSPWPEQAQDPRHASFLQATQPAAMRHDLYEVSSTPLFIKPSGQQRRSIGFMTHPSTPLFVKPYSQQRSTTHQPGIPSLSSRQVIQLAATQQHTALTLPFAKPYSRQ